MTTLETKTTTSTTTEVVNTHTHIMTPTSSYTTTTTSTTTSSTVAHVKSIDILELSGISFDDFDELPDNLDELTQQPGDIVVQDDDIEEANRGFNSEEEDMVDDLDWF